MKIIFSMCIGVLLGALNVNGSSLSQDEEEYRRMYGPQYPMIILAIEKVTETPIWTHGSSNKKYYDPKYCGISPIYTSILEDDKFKLNIKINVLSDAVKEAYDRLFPKRSKGKLILSWITNVD
jgi:hypothetical protein